MTIELTYKDLGNPIFLGAVKKLANHAGFKPQTAYNMAKIIAELDAEVRTYRGLRRQLVERHASVDETGRPVLNDGGLLQAETEQFNAVSVTIERPKITFQDLEGVALSPNEILGLSPLLAD